MGTNLTTCIIIVLMMTNISLQSQSIAKDDIDLQLQKHQKNDTVKVKLLNQLAYSSYKKDINKTLEYANKAYLLADSLNYTEGMAQALKMKGIYYDITSEYSKAIEYYQHALTLFEKLDDKEGVSASYHNIGVVYKIMEDYKQALIYYKKSLEIEKELFNRNGMAISYYTIANLYIKEHQVEEGLKFYNQALQLFRQLGNKSEIATCLNNIGIVYYNQNKIKEAEDLFQKSIEISIEIGDKFIEAPNYIELGKLYLSNYQTQKAYQLGNKAYTIATELGAIKLMKESAQLLAKSCKALGKYKEAYTYQKIFKTMSDSLINEDRIRKVTALEYQYRFEKEKHALQLEQQKKDAINMEKTKRQIILRNAFLIGFIMLLVIIGIILYALILKRKANKILKEKKSEIEVKNKKLLSLNNEIKELAESLDELNATKDKFFSIIAHDLKSPFSSIFGLSESLLEEHNSMDDGARQIFIERLYNSSKKIYKLLENLLTWAQIQRGAIQIKPEPFKICDLINGIKMLLSESINKKNLKIEMHCADKCKIWADKNMIETIIRNLLSNAIKFTPTGGQITISAEINRGFDTPRAIFSIKDTGIGIPSNIKENLFNPTKNESTPGTEKETGTGLGLLLCKEFVEKHGGNIWLESELGEGSIFHFTIPQKS